tara:strand:- start:2741 stop:3607 length:867 start_codon:yes stop_codon:yes gene_type:complete
MKIYDAIGFNSNLTGSFTGSFTGDGSGITGVTAAGTISSSIQIGSDISGSVSQLSASIATRFGTLTTDYTGLNNIPQGILSSSNQINALSNTSASYSTTSSFALTTPSIFPFTGAATINGTTTITGSLIVSGAAVTGSFVGDGSGLTNVGIVTASLVSETFSVTGSYTVRHNFGTKNVLTQVFDTNDFVITPSEIKTVNDNQVKISFSTSESGRVVVVKGGHLVTATQNTVSSSYAATAATSSRSVLSDTIHNNYLLSGSLKLWSGPKQVHDSISGSPDPNTIYFVKE